MRLKIAAVFFLLVRCGVSSTEGSLAACTENEYLDLSANPATCRHCSVCSDDLSGAGNYTVSNCTATNDTVCSRCEPDLIWSEDLARCVRCGPCCSNSTVDSACSEDPAEGCIYESGCTKINKTALSALSVTEAQEATRRSMPDATTDEPFEVATAIPVNYTEENTTTDRLVEMTDDSVHDSDLGSSSHKPLEGNVDTDMDTITDRPFDTITTSINDVENSIKPTMNSRNNSEIHLPDIPQNEPTNIPDNLMNDTEINVDVEKSETTENSDRKTGTIITDESDELVNNTKIYTSAHTTPETDRHFGADLPSELLGMNETEFDLTTISTLETTVNSFNGTKTDEITLNVLELSTASLNSNPDTTQDGRQELTEEVTISYSPDTMTSNESEAEPSIKLTETNTNYTQVQLSGNDKTDVEPTRVGLTPTTENVSDIVTGTEQDISTNTLLETTAQNYTEGETTTIGLRATTKNVSSTANDTNTTNYPPETTWDPKTGLDFTIGLRSTTGKDKFTVGPEGKIRNDTDSRNDPDQDFDSRNGTDQDFTTDSLLETTTKDFATAEPITVGLGPTTEKDSNIAESVDTSTSRPGLSVTTNNSVNDTKMEVYTTETGTWTNQGTSDIPGNDMENGITETMQNSSKDDAVNITSLGTLETSTTEPPDNTGNDTTTDITETTPNSSNDDAVNTANNGTMETQTEEADVDLVKIFGYIAFGILLIVVIVIYWVRRMVRKRRRKPGNVEEVELQPMNVADVELQRQQSDSNEDVEPDYYTGRRQNNGNIEQSTYLRPANCTQRFADTSSDDGYARPYEDGPCFAVETELDVGTPFPGRRRASLAERPLPPLPPRSRNSFYRRPPTPVPIDTCSNNRFLHQSTNYSPDSSDVTDTGYSDVAPPDVAQPLSALTLSKPAYENTGKVAAVHLNGKPLHTNQSNDTPPCTSTFVRHSCEDNEHFEIYECKEVDENPSNIQQIYHFPPKEHQAKEDSEDLDRISRPDVEDDDEFDDYIKSQENNKNYVDIYRREHCKINRLSLMVWGDSKVGKTTLVDRLTNSARSESGNSLRIVECAVSKNEMGITWYIPEDPFYQRVYQECDARFLPQGLKNSNVTKQKDSLAPIPTGILDLEIKIWDVSGVDAVYNSHKVFLAPSSVCLLVLNVGNGLRGIPEGGSAERTPLESLDHWLHMIDMCASQTKNGSHSECAIIVLTHTDVIDEAQRDRTIQEYKNQIIEHVQSKHTCKYVHPTVFALGNGNSNECDNELYNLQKSIVEKFESSRYRGVDANPWSWLKLEAGILKFFAEKERKYLSLKQLIFTVKKSYGMSMENLKSFLQFHLRYRNFIFDESALDILDNVYDTNVSHMITDALLIDEAFSAIISLLDQRNPLELNLHLRQRINLDAKQHLIALSSIEHLCRLNSINAVRFEDLAKLFVNFNLLIPYKSLDEKHTEKKYIVPTVMLSFDGNPVYNIFREPVKLGPLIYWFDQSPDLHYKEVSGFNISVLFCKFVSVWEKMALEKQAWKLLHMHSNAAAFRVGPQGQILAHITCQSCAIVLKLACIPNSMPENPGNLIPQIRWLIEGGIQDVIKDVFPGLQCSVCVSPCDAIKYECLTRLGNVGTNINQLHFAICTIHGKTLHPDTFSRWFGPDSALQNLGRESLKRKQTQKDIKELKKLSRNIGNKSTLESLAVALYVTPQEVDRRMTDSHRDIEGATFNVLYRDWYLRHDGFLTEGSSKLNKLQSAMDEAIGAYK